jgi:hypothetical protein
MAERISNIDKPVPERDPDTRSRLDGEAMAQRDTQIAALIAAHTPYRVIAGRLGISMGSVQKAVARLRGTPTPRQRRTRVPTHRSRFDTSADDTW